MRLPVILALCLLGMTDVGAQQAPPRPVPPSDGGRRVVIQPGRGRREAVRQARRVRNARLEPREPTATELASAYKDATARDIITRARQARAVQDSSLRSYDATVTQRISAGLNIKAIGADRLLFRSELAARVRWMTPDRVVVDMLGARTASPVAFPGTRVLTGFAEMVPIPWFTGAEGLMWWFNMDGGEDPGDEDDNPFRYLHPLADGAEVAYTYEAGEAATIRLPSGRTLALHEVIVRPREAQQEYIAGSLWFEAGAGQLVRAVFRPAAPFDMKQMLEREGDLEDIPAPIRSTLMTPFDFDVESFTVDYGLHEEKWWLPRVQSARGLLRTGFVRSTATIDQRFRYASVDGLDSLPAIPRGRDRFSRDVGDDVGFMVGGLVDAAVPGRVGRPREEVGMRCAKGDTTQHRQRRGDLRILVRTPCDTAALAHSDLLPPSIFEPGEEAFGIAEARALAKELKVDELLATRGGAAPPSSSPWTLTWGLQRGMLRYNRVEGLSAGVLAERPVGRGITMATTVRLGSADLDPNAEVRFIRDRLGRSLTLGAYRRLDVVDDWGDPFGIGGSLSALLFGRDEGHYARGTGIDLVGLHARGAVTWRLFAERQDGAVVETDLSLPHLTREARFRPNVRAAEADEGGGQLRIRLERGLDPQGWRVASEARLEAAAGSYDYTRATGSASLSRGLFNMAAVSVSGSAGTSGGQLTPQRAWRLGGTHTVRGQRPAVQSGNAFWLARAEVGRSGAGMRPVAFYDMGWAGDRTAWNVGEKVRGAGVGLSILDGLMRVDLARGVRPTTAWRAHLYVEARF